MVANRFVTQWMTDAHEILKVYALDGTFEREIALPAIGSVGGFTGKRKDHEGFYAFSSFAHPGAVYRYDFAASASTVFRQPKVAFDPADFETVQVFYPSKDGTKIPMFLTYKKGLKKDGANPTLSLRLRRLQHLADAGLLAGAHRVDGDGRHLRAAEPARRRRVRQGRGTTPDAWRRSRTSSTTSSRRPNG